MSTVRCFVTTVGYPISQTFYALSLESSLFGVWCFSAMVFYNLFCTLTSHAICFPSMWQSFGPSRFVFASSFFYLIRLYCLDVAKVWINFVSFFIALNRSISHVVSCVNLNGLNFFYFIFRLRSTMPLQSWTPCRKRAIRKEYLKKKKKESTLMETWNAVFRIRPGIRIPGSVPLNYGSGSGSCFILQWLSGCQQKG